MFNFKNVFITIVILAILLGGTTGLYLAKMKKPMPINNTVSTSSGANPEKVGEVLKKINNLTNE